MNPHGMDTPSQSFDDSQALELLRERTRELAALKGRAAHEVTQEDFEAAKRDLSTNPRPWTPRRPQTSASAAQESSSLSPGLAHACLMG